LTGAIAGSFLVNGAKSWFTVAAPEMWLYFLGVLFILTTLFLPQGFIKMGAPLKRYWRRLVAGHKARRLKTDQRLAEAVSIRAAQGK
jgi:hypothetical protein